MQSGYYSAAGGMVTQMNRLEHIANNLANVNTAGFKKDNQIVGDFLRLYKNARDDLPLQSDTKEAAQFFNRSIDRVPQITDRYTDFSLGHMQKSGNTLDFALGNENLFFAVKTPNGVRLTRDGSFTLNEEGILVTKQGFEVLPSDYFKSKNAISFDAVDMRIEADKNGQLYTKLSDSAQLIQKAKLMIVSPENIQKLTKEGNNLFIPESIDSLRIEEQSGAVMQGFVEKSNVNAVNEMVAMIEANRLVGMYQKAMDSQMNDLNRDAIEKIAVTR